MASRASSTTDASTARRLLTGALRAVDDHVRTFAVLAVPAKLPVVFPWTYDGRPAVGPAHV